MSPSLHNIGRLDALIEPMLRSARIPGVAIAVVAGTETVFARGFGYRDLAAKLPMTAETIYPIASTTKALNATLLGMLVDEGRIAWDAPVQHYLPRFRLQDPLISAQLTLRDLVTMRTGLPRHDYVWLGSRITRAELIQRLAHLPLSAGLRERFQYNNLTTAVAGHVAEIVTGRSWEDLIRARLLEPLAMRSTGFAVPPTGNATCAYHEDSRRNLILTPRLVDEVVAPAGTSMHSSVTDMARWLAFNLNGGRAAEQQLILAETVQDIHLPHVVMGADPAAPSPTALYGLGWCVDAYHGSARISHTGHHDDINSCVTLFPEQELGMVSFTNFASARLAAHLNQYAFDLIMGFEPAQTFERALALYEKKIEDTRRRNASVRRVTDKSPSHPLQDYAGRFEHAGYGRIEIRQHEGALIYEGNGLVLPLEHWHYDAWVVADNDLFEIHAPHAYDRASRFLFDTNADGEICAVSIELEPAVPPIRFQKQRTPT